MTEHPLERPECPCGGDHPFTDCPQQAADTFGPITVRLVMLAPHQGPGSRYYVVDLDEAGQVVDAAWVGGRHNVPAWMERDRLTGHRGTIAYVAESIAHGAMVSEQEHLRVTETAALPPDTLDLASDWA